MNELEKVLYRSRKTVPEGCFEAGIKFESAVISNIQECSSCNVWLKPSMLIPDLDGYPICKSCQGWYGM